MNSNLLRTKLFIPEPRQNYLLRPKLLELLDGAISRKLTLVAAPPGYGKTTLLSVWIEERNFPAAWLSLDPEDNENTIFIRYLISAMQQINPEIGQVSLALLKSTQPFTSALLLSPLLNDLSTIEDDCVLVLDDYHNIENQSVHESMAYLLDHLPPKLHIILASRSDPPLPLSRLRARDQLLEIRQVDLRLSISEAEQFLNGSLGLKLSELQISQLETRTEGWFAGLQFAGLSLNKQENLDAFLESFSGSHRYVIDYLADEVCSTLTEDMQDFLKEIAILNRFTASLCDALTGRQDSELLLNQLEENNLFLIALDEHRKWYRFHPLFLDYLRTLHGDQPQDRLHSLATNWFMNHLLYTEAVKHAAASRDMELLKTAVTRAARGAFEQGEINSLSSWLNYLPEQELMNNSQLATYKGMLTFFSLNPETAVPYLNAARENLPPNPLSSHLGQLMCLQAHIALYQGDLNQSVKLSREALEYLEDDDLFFRNLTLNVLGQILEMKSDVAGAVEIYQQAFRASQNADDQLGSLVIFTNLIFALNELGKHAQALRLCQEFAADPKWVSKAGLAISDGVNLPWSLLSYETNELDVAESQVQLALQRLELVDIPQGKLWAQYILGSIYLANEEFDKLALVTAQARQLASISGSNAVHFGWFEMLDAQASLIQGDITPVERWISSNNFSPKDSPHHWFEQQYFTYARMLITQGKNDDARLLLSTMKANAMAGKRQRKLISIYLLQALVESASGQQEKTIENLERALALAAPQDYVRAFINEGKALLDILPTVKHLAPEFIDKILSDQNLTGMSKPKLIEPYETLSDRELEVLRLVARGYSNRQIAEALVITLGTVKKHLNNIFGKLQVKNRTEAVAQARMLQLLE